MILADVGGLVVLRKNAAAQHFPCRYVGCIGGYSVFTNAINVFLTIIKLNKINGIELINFVYYAIK